MKLLNHFAKLLATTATIGLLAAPIASADRGGRDGYNRGHNGHHARHNNRRGHNAHHNKRRGHHARRHNRHGHHYRGHRRAHRGYHRNHHYRGHHHRPRHYYRHARRHHHGYPHYGYGGSSVTFSYSTGPSYHRPHYSPRYHVGGHYAYHPRTTYVRDYGRYGLYDPPHGYHWVHDHDRGDAILASVATGAIIGLVVGAIAYD